MDIWLSLYIFSPLAILSGLIHFLRLSDYSRALVAFLIWGMIIDHKNYFLPAEASLSVYYLYVASEVLFLSWFMRSLISGSASKLVLFAFMILASAGWFVCFCLFASGPLDSRVLPGVYDLVTSGSIAFLSAYGLFRLSTEPGRLEKRHAFWYLCGIFLYFM
jgi:hypothetical protein